MIGRITADPLIEQVKNGEAKALFAQVELSTGEIRTVQLFPGAGDETWPCKGDVVVVERKGGLLYASALWDKSEPELKPGEKTIYGRNADGEKVSRAVFLDTGEMQIETIKGKSLIVLKESGEIEINSKEGAKYIFSDKHFIGNNATNLYKVILDITDIIKNLHTVGAPGAHTVLAADQAKVALIEADVKQLLTEEA